MSVCIAKCCVYGKLRSTSRVRLRWNEQITFFNLEDHAILFSTSPALQNFQSWEYRKIRRSWTVVVSSWASQEHSAPYIPTKAASILHIELSTVYLQISYYQTKHCMEGGIYVALVVIKGWQPFFATSSSNSKGELHSCYQPVDCMHVAVSINSIDNLHQPAAQEGFLCICTFSTSNPL